MLRKHFQLASNVDKGKSKQKTEESIPERVKLKNEKIAEIKKEKKNINSLLFNYYFADYQNPSNMYKKLHETKRKRNEDQVYSIKEILDKKNIKNVPKNKKFKLNEEIINIVECIFYFKSTRTTRVRLKNINTKPNA